MYRLEIIDSKIFQIRSACMISEDIEIFFDYIAPAPFAVDCKKIDVEEMDFIRISNGVATVFEGYVSSYTQKGNTTELILNNLLLLLDYESVQNTKYSICSSQIWQQITYDYCQEAPTLFKMPWKYSYEEGLMTNWDGVKVTYGGKLLSDMYCIILAAKMYGKYMRLYIADDMYPTFSYYSTPQEIIIEADLKNIIEKEITVDVNFGYNIAMIWFPTGHRQAYILDDGTISYDIADSVYISYPRLVAKTVDKDFATNEEAEAALLEMLKPAENNNQIVLTVNKDDKILIPAQMQIGQPVTIITAGKAYKSALTGRNIKGQTIKLIFGSVRFELTKKLKELI